MSEQTFGPGTQTASSQYLRSTFYFRAGKRALDILFAAAGLLVWAPFMLVCAMAIRLNSPGPVFFRQTRVGQYGRNFKILKFRTMFAGAERSGPNLTVSKDPRVTSVGKVLRRAKLDELPQLINVLFGDMSLVGPRPETPDHVALYNDIQREVLAVRPGITGRASLAFINEEEILAGAADIEKAYRVLLMPRKLQQELAYCGSITLGGDLALMCNTVLRVFRHAKDRHEPR